MSRLTHEFLAIILGTRDPQTLQITPAKLDGQGHTEREIRIHEMVKAKRLARAAEARKMAQEVADAMPVTTSRKAKGKGGANATA